MSKTVAFLAEIPGSATLDAQKACLGTDDYAILAGKRSFTRLAELVARSGLALEAGDRVKIYELTCLALSTTTLIRALSKLLEAGIAIEVVSPGLVIEPDEDGKMRALLVALDQHYRHVHGIKTHPATTARQGRKRLLDPVKLPEIRAMLDTPGATATGVAQELGVARSTLFNFLDRYDRARRTGRREQSRE